MDSKGQGSFRASTSLHPPIHLSIHPCIHPYISKVWSLGATTAWMNESWHRQPYIHGVLQSMICELPLRQQQSENKSEERMLLNLLWLHRLSKCLPHNNEKGCFDGYANMSIIKTSNFFFINLVTALTWRSLTTSNMTLMKLLLFFLLLN